MITDIQRQMIWYVDMGLQRYMRLSPEKWYKLDGDTWVPMYYPEILEQKFQDCKQNWELAQDGVPVPVV